MREENECLAKDWELIPFNSNIEMLSGFPFDSSLFSDSDGKPLIRIRNINSGKTKTYFKGEYSKEYLINKGDILVGMDGDFHIKKWQGSESLLNQRILKLYENEASKINLDFFYYLSQPFLLKVHKRTSGTTVKHLSTKDFKNASFKVPNYPEQQKIAEILSTVDAKIEVIAQQISETQELKKGLMQTLLTKGIGHSEFKDSALGEIPKSWEVVKLGDIGEFFKGKGISKSEILKEGKYSCIRYGEIYTIYDTIIYQLKSFINQDSANKSNSFNSGDLLFTGSGETAEDIGKCVTYIGNEKAFASGDLIIHRPNKGNSKFLSYMMNSSIVRNQTRKLGQGNSVVHIYTKHLSQITFALPPLPEQQKIASILSTVDNKLDVLLEKKGIYQELKTGLMQVLLTGKVRVKV